MLVMDKREEPMPAKPVGKNNEEVEAFIEWMQRNGCDIIHRTSEYIQYETYTTPATKYHSNRAVMGTLYKGRIAVKHRDGEVRLYTEDEFNSQFKVISD